jgi:hypothetical protein
MTRRKRKGKQDPRKHGTVEQHKLVGKKLLAPFEQMERLKPSSWINERLPDQIASALLITRLDREYALDLLRNVAYLCRGTFQKGMDLDFTLKGLALMPAELAERAIGALCRGPEAVEALQSLMLFDDLPGRDRWAHHFPAGMSVSAWHHVADAVAQVLSHQSQQATDTRWARVLFRVSTGQYVVPADHFNWYTRYPREEDQRIVRPSIRAAEIAENT